MECKICNKECNGLKGLSIHLKKKHIFNDIELKNYYDKHTKKENEGKCYFCNSDAIFFGFSKGYHRICNSKKCLGKTRATGTYEFLMYKYNLSKEDAIKLMNKRASERGKKIKNGLEKSFNENENFFKERSHQTKEYWIKQGLSEEKSIEKSIEIMDMIHNKTWKKRREHPELYNDVNTTQIGYWLKKGYTEEESKEKIKERQKTFTLEKCIIKYGKEEGTKIYHKRQIKWQKSMKKKILKNNFKNDYSKIEKELIDNILLKSKININDQCSYINKQFLIYNENKQYYTFDFKYKNKIIEFNGDFWHMNPLKYKETDIHKVSKKTAKEIWNYDNKKINSIKNNGYDVLIIWENDYKQNKEKVIQECITFIKKND